MRVVLSIAFVVGLAAGLPARATDLVDAYRLARNADPVVAGAAATRRVVAEGVAQARAPLLPQVSAGYGFSQRNNDGNDPGNRTRGADASASLTQVVFDEKLHAQVGVARAQSEAQAATLVAAEQALCLRVADAYFTVLLAEDTLVNVAANEEAFQRQVEQADQRYRNGLSAAVDYEQARAYHATAQARTIDARSALADAREALAEIVGVPTTTLKPLRADLPLDAPTPADPQAWVQRALAGNPTLAAQARSVDAAEQGIGAARKGHLPSVTAGLGVGRASSWPNGLANDPGNGRTVGTLGLTLSVPIFSGGIVESQVRQATAQRDVAADELEARRRRVARETLDHYRGVLAAIGQIEATRTAVAAAGRALESTRVGLSLGTQTMTDLLLAIQTLSAARDAQSQARYRYILSRLLLLQSAGTISETDLGAVNALLQ